MEFQLQHQSCQCIFRIDFGKCSLFMTHQFVHCKNRKWPQGGTTHLCPTQVSGETRALGRWGLWVANVCGTWKHKSQRPVSNSSCFTADLQVFGHPCQKAILQSCPLEVRGLEAKGLQAACGSRMKVSSTFLPLMQYLLGPFGLD